MKNKINRIFAAAKKDTVLEVLVYETIGPDYWGDGGVTAKNLAAQIKDAGDFSSIQVRINSPGGSAFEGVAIANLLRAQGKPISVNVDGLAASAASIIAMCGDTISMGTGSMMMIHNAWTVGYGNAQELRKIADTLEKVSTSIAEMYIARTGKSAAEIKSLMDAETWLSAEECVNQKFADSVSEREADEQAQAMALAASFNLSGFSKTPAALTERAQEQEIAAAETPAAEEIPSDEPPADSQPPDWESQLSVYRKRLELVGE
jgi:ATP-dependent Clp protease, protease subunit